jgi:hypothetical protein
LVLRSERRLAALVRLFKVEILLKVPLLAVLWVPWVVV